MMTVFLSAMKGDYCPPPIKRMAAEQSTYLPATLIWVLLIYTVDIH
jgi:hypothetical protein